MTGLGASTDRLATVESQNARSKALDRHATDLHWFVSGLVQIA